MTSTYFSKTLKATAEGIYTLFLVAIVYPSIWVSAAIASLVLVVQNTLGLDLQWPPVLLIFSAALIPYNLDRIADTYMQEIPDRNAQAFFRQGWGGVMLVAGIIGTAVLLYRADPAVRWVSLGGLVPLVYGLPLFPWQRDGQFQWYRLKDIPASKAWIVCGTITYALIAVPLAYAGEPFTLSAGITAAFLLIFIGTNSHLFDVRDLKSDRETGVLTLPRLVGVDGNRKILSVLNVTALVIVAVGWRYQLAVPSPAIAIPCVLANVLALQLIQPDTPRDTYGIYVDGYLFLPAVIKGLAAIATFIQLS